MHSTRRSRPLALIALTGALAACADSGPLGPDLTEIDPVVAPMPEPCPAIPLTGAQEDFESPKGKKGGWGTLLKTGTTSSSTTQSLTSTTGTTGSTGLNGAADATASGCGS